MCDCKAWPSQIFGNPPNTADQPASFDPFTLGGHVLNMQMGF